MGDCGLSDGSSAGNWRLPNVNELLSLIDRAYFEPALSDAAGTARWADGDAFSGVHDSDYWSSTTYEPSCSNAWQVNLFNGTCDHIIKTEDNYVWPVRGGR